MNRQISNQTTHKAIMEYKNVTVDGVPVFYREIGDHINPKTCIASRFSLVFSSIP